MPGVSGVTVVTNARVYYTTRGCGRTKRPAFPTPSFSGERFRHDPGATHRGNAGAYPDVIASAAKQSTLSFQRLHGLLDGKETSRLAV
jgi:hypothetical protein